MAMSSLSRSAALASRLSRPTIRLRLTVFYGGLFLVSGAALLAVTYLLVRYTFPSTSTHTYASRPPPGGSVASRLRPPPGLPSLAVLRAQDARQRQADLHQLVVGSGIALVAMTALSAVLGWVVAGRVLRPLRTITSAARDLSSANLSRRLALAGPDDELKELGDTFDALLARLERSFQSQRLFVANASHELRTPLTLERALLEAVLTDPEPTTDSLLTTCERLLAATIHQERLIEALLTLATSERGIERWEPVDLAALAEQDLLARRHEAERLGVDIDTTLRCATMAGDPVLVGRLVGNLTDNALRYNQSGGRIEVITGKIGGVAVISVSNTGPIITAQGLDQLFEPFRRFGPHRTRHDDGHGLGLSIVASIAKAHGAAISARPRPEGGLDVEVRFPAGNCRAKLGAPRPDASTSPP